MASVPRRIQDHCDSETEEETLALKKKRSRRVSFADREITSVHIFNRDEDNDTPSDTATSTNSEKDAANDEILGFFRGLADVDDSKGLSPTAVTNDADDEDDNIIGDRKSFFRPIESPSPGSIIGGSATSNEEDNYFGPVSASFIRPRRLSDSAASDDIHDVTMDSTAFSMHYRSLLGSESGGEDKTPHNVTTLSDPGSYMVLTKTKRLVSESPFGVERVVSGGRDTSDMSLVGENPRSYDYGKLSPELEVLLAEGRMDLPTVSVSESTNAKSISGCDVLLFDENGSSQRDLIDGGDKEMGNVGRSNLSTGGVSATSKGMDKLNAVSGTTIVNQITCDISPNRAQNFSAVSVDHGMQSPAPQLSKSHSPNHLGKINNDQSKTVIETSTLNLGFPAVSHGILSNMDDKILQLDSITPHESGWQSTQSLLNQNSSKKKRQSDNSEQDSEKQRGFSLAGSISSLSANKQQIFLDATNSCRKLSYATPSPKQSESILCKENMRSGEVTSSTYKSSTMLKIFEPSPLASALKDGIERSKLRISKVCSSAAFPSSTVLENRKYTEGKHMDTPVTNLGKRLFSVDVNNKYTETTSYMNTDGVGTPKNDTSLSKSEGPISLAAEETPNMSTHFLSSEKGTQPLIKVASPSPQKVRQQMAKPEKSTKGALAIPEFGATLMEIKQSDRNDIQSTNAPDLFVSPSLERLDQKLPSSTENQGSASVDLKQRICYGESIGPGHETNNSIGNVTSKRHTPTVTDNQKPRCAERAVQSSSPLLEINHSQLPSPARRVDDRQSYIAHRQHASETVLDFQASLRDVDAPHFHYRSPLDSGSTYSDERLSGEKNKSSPCASASLYVCKSTNEPAPKAQSPNPQLSPGPSGKEQHNALTDNNLQPLVGKEKNTFLAQDMDNSSRQKRRIDEPVLGDADHAEKIRRVRDSPKVYKSQRSGLEFILDCPNGSDEERQTAGVNDCSSVLLKFSEETKQLLSPLIDNLNITAIGVLQDILVCLEKVKMFEMLRTQIQTQKIYDLSGKIRNERLVETRSLLCKLVYEKARLQLLFVKREKLQKRAQQLCSGIQDSMTLNSNSLWRSSIPGERDTLIHNLPNSDVVNFGTKEEVSREKVVTMRHECEVLERKIKNLTKSLHFYCKMKGEPSFSETIALLSDHLKQRTSCQLIRKNLQLWEAEDLGKSSSHPSILLNYQGFIHQRFVINAVPTPSVFISNQINDINILKNFPNMDACTAFAYVLNSGITKKHVDSKNLAQETQITSLLLHNLLDVVGEVQLAQIETKYLVQTIFRSPTVERLDLQLCFVDFKSSGKVILTLDMTCLSCGVYPSEILPCQLQASFAGAQKLSGSLSAEINTALGGLRVGYFRIIRLCRCVSQVLQSSSS